VVSARWCPFSTDWVYNLQWSISRQEDWLWFCNIPLCHFHGLCVVQTWPHLMTACCSALL
jgi:hypothetical protein